MNTPGGAKMISYRGWAKFAKFAIAFEEPSKKYPFEFEFLHGAINHTGKPHTHTQKHKHTKKEKKKLYGHCGKTIMKSLW